MRNNVVTAVAGDRTYIRTDPVFQYDYGLKLVVEGITLPEEYEVQFGNTNSAANKTVNGNAQGVLIPDEYLVNGEDVHAYVFLHTTEDDGYSVYHIHIPVMDRAAIAEEEITPYEHNVIKEALEKIAEAVDESNANVTHYPYINEEEYWMVYDATLGEFVNTGIKANGDNAFDLSIGTVTTLAPGTPATANVVWDGDHAYLNLGLPAGDASAMVSIHDERTNMKTITIHDGANNIAVDEIRIAVEPAMEGSGTPGPRNIRRINPVNSIALTHTAGAQSVSVEREFGEDPGPVYGATFYPITGRLVVDRVLMTKRCVDMDNLDVQPGWRNSGVKQIAGAGVSQIYDGQFLNIGTSYGVDTTGDNDILYLPTERYGMRQTEWINTEITVQVCVMLAEPIEYQLTPYTPIAKLGDNTYSVDNGKIAYLKYPCDTKTYVDRKIAEVQALVLEM